MTQNTSTVDAGDWDEIPSEPLGEICELIWQISLDQDSPLMWDEN